MQYLPSAMKYVVCALQYQVTIVKQWYMQYLPSAMWYVVVCILQYQVTIVTQW